MQMPVGRISVWLTALALASGFSCSVDTAGLQTQDASVGAAGTGLPGVAGSGGAGGNRGAAGNSGLAGSSGVAGASSGVAGSLAGAAGMGGAAVSGTAGAAGDNGSGGTGGVPGTGGVGTGGDGPAGTSGAAGVSGEAGAAGNAAAGNTGAGGNAGSAGTGGRGGFFGFGGRGGRGGNGGSSSCPVAGCGPCFRCGAMGCEPEPAATWKVVCESAIIAPTKPSGNAWDPNASSGPGNGPLPDAFCELTVDSRSKSSSIDGDSLMPVWNDDVTPGMASLTAAVLTSNDDRWQLMVIDQDNATSSMETICTVNHVTAADLMGGSATFTQVDSCTELVLRLQCAAGPSQP